MIEVAYVNEDDLIDTPSPRREPEEDLVNHLAVARKVEHDHEHQRECEHGC